MLVAVFLILMGSLIDVLAIESQNSTESANSSAAVTAAYSGVDLMILSIEEFYQNGIQGGQPPKTIACDFGRPGGGAITTQCSATIDQTWNSTGINYFLIRSTGSALPSTDKEVDRQVVALVKQVPFGAYAHFSESENSNTGDKIWYSWRQSFDGPVYSGGSMHIMYNGNNWRTPIFPMGFTTDQPKSHIHWYDAENQDGKPPQTQDQVLSVFGTSNPTFAQNAINLPGFAQNLAVFSEAFYGDDTHDNNTDLAAAGQNKGVFVNGGDPNCPSGTLCSGIFVSGNNVQISGSSVADPNGTLASGTQTWQISSPDFATTTVTVNFGANTTTVSVGGSTKTYAGVASGEQSDSSQGNGAFFVDGNLTVADGTTVHGQYTVAVPDPPVNNEGITLDGSVKDATDPQGGNPSQDELALWADTISLNATESKVTVEAMVLTGYANECVQKNCGGWFGNVYCKQSGCNGGGQGILTLYGSDIENLYGKMGVVDDNGDPLAGYIREQTYDPRLGAVPPPFSPTTNLSSVVALQDVGFPGH